MDIKSPSDAHVMAGFHRSLPEHAFQITVRDRAEAIALAKSYGLPYKAVGKDDPQRGQKVLNYAWRLRQLSRALEPWDASLSFNNMNAILLSRLARKPSITLMDNDLELDAGAWSLAKRAEMWNNVRATRILVPSVFPAERLVELGAKRDAIATFEGYKEDLYLADFVPDPAFPATLPFSDYIVLRPEALSAVYVQESRSIVGPLAEGLVKAGLRVVYLPRVPSDRDHLPASVRDRVHVPETPPNGLQLCWHARAVLTGSGSLAREAACLGVPSVSFFPNRLLAVDRSMVEQGRVFHSRDPAAILDHVAARSARAKPTTARSIAARDAVNAQIRAFLGAATL
jgi:uncharacterized protein